MEKIKFEIKPKALDGCGQFRIKINFFLDTEDYSKAKKIEKAIKQALSEE